MSPDPLIESRLVSSQKRLVVSVTSLQVKLQLQEEACCLLRFLVDDRTKRNPAGLSSAGDGLAAGGCRGLRWAAGSPVVLTSLLSHWVMGPGGGTAAVPGCDGAVEPLSHPVTPARPPRWLRGPRAPGPPGPRLLQSSEQPDCSTAASGRCSSSGTQLDDNSIGNIQS